MGLFGPAWKSGNVDKAIRAVEKMTDESELLTVALEATTQARFAALKRIQDSSLLLRAASQSSDRSIYEAALARVTDIEALKAFCAVEGDSHKGLCADSCLSKLLVEKADPALYQADLKRIALKSAFLPGKAAQKLTARSDLIEVAIKAKYDAARAAIDKLSGDPAALCEIVFKSEKTRALQALESLRDQDQLEKIALGCPESACRKAAVERLNKEAAVARVALEDSSAEVRLAAAGCIASPSMLARIAAEDPDRYVRCAAIDRIEDQSLLNKIATTDGDALAACHAAQRLTDQAAFDNALRRNPGIVKNSEALLGRAKDPQALYAVAMDDQLFPRSRILAVKAMEDYELLRKLIKECRKHDVVEAARERKEVLERQRGLCPKCGRALSPDELSHCRCGACGAEAHDFRFSEENVVSATERDSYWSRDIYRVCRRCGKREFVTKYEGWGTDVD